jgi:hypothetical protein
MLGKTASRGGDDIVLVDLELWREKMGKIFPLRCRHAMAPKGL